MIRHLEISTSSVTTLAGKTFDGSDDGFGTNARFLSPARLAISQDGNYAFVAFAKSPSPLATSAP
jgi:DNA-binding beta-propeller fold protein YncE